MRRPKLSEEVIDTIRRAILSGAYAPGERLRLETLASQLGTSVMPVRESLIALSNEGLVIAQPRRGFVANPLDDEETYDLYDLQGYIAGKLAGRAALSATDEQIHHLKTIQQEMRRLSRRRINGVIETELLALNAAYHKYISRIPKGNRLRWFLRVSTQFTQVEPRRVTPGWLKMTLSDHAKINAALEAHNFDLARRLMEAHFIRGAGIRDETARHEALARTALQRSGAKKRK